MKEAGVHLTTQALFGDYYVNYTFPLACHARTKAGFTAAGHPERGMVGSLKHHSGLLVEEESFQSCKTNLIDTTVL